MKTWMQVIVKDSGKYTGRLNAENKIDAVAEVLSQMKYGWTNVGNEKPIERYVCLAELERGQIVSETERVDVLALYDQLADVITGTNAGGIRVELLKRFPEM